MSEIKAVSAYASNWDNETIGIRFFTPRLDINQMGEQYLMQLPIGQAQNLTESLNKVLKNVK